MGRQQLSLAVLWLQCHVYAPHRLPEIRKTLEQILGVDLPDDVIEKIVNAVKANLTAEDIGDLVGAAMKIFKK